MGTTPEYFGTENADVVTRAALAPGTFWALYYGNGGDDNITWSSGRVIAGAGNDTIIRLTNDNSSVYATYWTSPKGVYIDLQAGYALDGFGTRDTLVNINSIDDSSFNDTIYGGSGDDWINSYVGQDYIDGRDGVDTVSMTGPASAWKIDTSVDGRTVKLIRIDNPTARSAELHHVEWIIFDGYGASEKIRVSDLIDSAQKGPQTLIESPSIRWNAAQPMGSAVTITYSFTNSIPTYGAGVSGAVAQAWNATQQAQVRAALATLASQTLITFSEVTDSASSFGQLRFGINTQSSKDSAYLPDPSAGNLAGDVWLSSMTAANLGASGRSSFLSDLGRALGLKAPLTESYTGTLPVLVNTENDTRFTVMSPIDAMNGAPRDSFGIYDLAALRSLYGTRSADNGDNTTVFTDKAGLSQTTIVDESGSNTLDASAVSAGVRWDLRQGKLSSVGRDAQDLAAVDNVGLAYGTIITTAIGSKFDDVIIGNEGNNFLKGLAGNDMIDGGAGIDSALYAGKRADYTLSVSAFSGKLFVAALNGTEGTDSLVNIERLVYSDMTVNLGIVKKAATIPLATLRTLEELYVGFFNRVPDADGLSYWIDQIVGGNTINQVGDAFYSVAAQYASLTGYSATMSNADFIKVVYKNVLGRSSVDQGGLDYWGKALDSGIATRGALVASILTSAHSFKGDKDFGYVADLLDNKLTVATAFAIEQGLSDNTAETAIVHGMAIAAAVTPTDILSALKLIGVADSGFMTA